LVVEESGFEMAHEQVGVGWCRASTHGGALGL
jgi:hypothetical protein